MDAIANLLGGRFRDQDFRPEHLVQASEAGRQINYRTVQGITEAVCSSPAAGNHAAGGDADPHGELNSMKTAACDRVTELHRSPNRRHLVLLMRVAKIEHRQHNIPLELNNRPLVLLYQ
jgi:hypothetical protein